MALQDGTGMTSTRCRERRKLLVAIAIAVLIALNLHGLLAIHATTLPPPSASSVPATLCSTRSRLYRLTSC